MRVYLTDDGKCETCGKKKELYHSWKGKRWINDSPYCHKCRHIKNTTLNAPTKEEIENFKVLYNQKTPLRKIADITGYGKHVVIKHLKDEGLYKIKLKPVTDIEKKTIVRLYKRGMNFKNIGDVIKRPGFTVKWWVKKFIRDGKLKAPE